MPQAVTLSSSAAKVTSTASHENETLTQPQYSTANRSLTIDIENENGGGVVTESPLRAVDMAFVKQECMSKSESKALCNDLLAFMDKINKLRANTTTTSSNNTTNASNITSTSTSSGEGNYNKRMRDTSSNDSNDRESNKKRLSNFIDFLYTRSL